MINPYPTPSFQYQGSSLTTSGCHIGPFPVIRPRSFGINYAVDTSVSFPNVHLRPVELDVVDDDACTTSFEVFYTQYRTDPEKDGLEWRMAFRLTSDRDGGVIGVHASLTVESNYPEIDMSIQRFTFNQPGFGISKDAVLPRDYQARLTVRVWNRDAKLALDGWMMLECLYFRDDAIAQADELVSVGRAALYPASSRDAPLSPRVHQPPKLHRL